jgi:ADP-heptose:LPS heptosyltransferase
MPKIPANIIISRTDSIGDVVLTLPVAAVLKMQFPAMTIAFMGKAYTRPVIEACTAVDLFIDKDDFLQKEILINGKQPEAILHVFPQQEIARRAKALQIPLRIGTTNRLYHWYTCNELVTLSRKNSALHEAQLNLKLLDCFGVDTDFSLSQIIDQFPAARLEPLAEKFRQLIDPHRYNLILHPKSQGSGREWPLDHYVDLVRNLDPNRYKIFISGTAKERALLEPLFNAVGDMVTDITGMMSLSQFISFIHQCNGMLASSTGPIHLAAISGIDALAIFPPIRPLHPGRWQPLGKKVKVFVLDKNCSDCRKFTGICACVSGITPIAVQQYLDSII